MSKFHKLRPLEANLPQRLDVSRLAAKLDSPIRRAAMARVAAISKEAQAQPTLPPAKIQALKSRFEQVLTEMKTCPVGIPLHELELEARGILDQLRAGGYKPFRGKPAVESGPYGKGAAKYQSRKCKTKDCWGSDVKNGYCKGCREAQEEDNRDGSRGEDRYAKVAHPVWDLSFETASDPVVVRKVPEQAERGKQGEPGWLGRMAVTYIGGKPVELGKVSSVNQDGSISVQTADGVVAISPEFCDFLADRGDVRTASSQDKSAAGYVQEWKNIWNAVKPQSKSKKKTPSGGTGVGMEALAPGRNPDGSLVLPDPEDLKQMLLKALPSISGRTAQQMDLPGVPSAPPPPSQGINVTQPMQIRGPTIRPMINELLQGIDRIRTRTIDRMVAEYARQKAPSTKEQKYMDIIWWWNREVIIQKQLGELINVLEKTVPQDGKPSMKGPYEQKPIQPVTIPPPQNTGTTVAGPGQTATDPNAPPPPTQQKGAALRDVVRKIAQRMGPNAQATFELQYIIRVLTKFGFPITDKAKLMQILELNKNHAVSNIIEAVPDQDWAAFIGSVGKPAADDKSLVDSRPEWWTQFQAVTPDSEKYFDDYGIDEEPPMTMDEATNKPRTAQFTKNVKQNWMALEWLWWMADAGFSINSYENMRELAAMFPATAHRGPQLAASMSDVEYEQLWRSGAINQFGRTMELPEKYKQHSEGDRPPVENAWPDEYKKWRQNTNVNEPVNVIREVPKDNMMETDEEMSMSEAVPAKQPARSPPKPAPTQNLVPTSMGPQRITREEVKPMPGFQMNQVLKQPGGKLSVLITRPGGRDTTTAYIGQGVRLNKTDPGGFGYIIGQNEDGLPIIWLEKIQDTRAADPKLIEQDLKGRKLTASLLDVIRRAQQAQPPVVPGQQPGGGINTTNAPGSPATPDGQPAQPGDMVAPPAGGGQAQDPQNSGTIQQVNPDGGIVYQNQQGQQMYKQPGENMQVVPSGQNA